MRVHLIAIVVVFVYLCTISVNSFIVQCTGGYSNGTCYLLGQVKLSGNFPEYNFELMNLPLIYNSSLLVTSLNGVHMDYIVNNTCSTFDHQIKYKKEICLNRLQRNVCSVFDIECLENECDQQGWFCPNGSLSITPSINKKEQYLQQQKVDYYKYVDFIIDYRISDGNHFITSRTCEILQDGCTMNILRK
jgi:hypothetical protein